MVRAGHLSGPDRDRQFALRIGRHIVKRHLAPKRGDLHRRLRGGGEVHHPARFGKHRQQQLNQQIGRQRVDHETRVQPGVGARLGQFQDTGIVDHHVYLAVINAQRLCQRHDLFQPRQVRAVGLGIAAHLRRGGAEFLGTAPVQQNAMPLRAELFGGQQTDTVGRAGDEDRLGHLSLLTGSLRGDGSGSARSPTAQSLLADHPPAFLTLMGRAKVFHIYHARMFRHGRA